MDKATYELTRGYMTGLFQRGHSLEDVLQAVRSAWLDYEQAQKEARSGGGSK